MEYTGSETDYGWVYDNFEDFKEDHPDLAKELLKHVEPGEWQDNDIEYYPTPDEYADYEVCEGWYTGLFDGKDLSTMDYNGAPSLYDYLDLNALGKALVENGDATTTFELSNGGIVETMYGWELK